MRLPAFGSPLIQSALQSIRSKSGRTALSCLSLVLGVLSIVVVEVASSTAAQVILHPAELRQGRSQTWAVTAAASPQSLLAAERVVRQWQGDAALVVTDQPAVAREEATSQRIEVTVYAGDLRAIRPFPIVSGKWPANQDSLQLTLAVNLAAARLGNLTLQFTPGSRAVPFQPTAVVDDGNASPQVWVPLRQMRSRAGADPDGTLQIVARLAPGMATVTGSELNLAARTFDLQTNGSAQRVDKIEELAATLNTMRITFLIVGAVTLLVGVIGILNIGLATLNERSEEFALRRSLGATQKDVAVLVLAESVMIGLLGAIVASGVCWALYVALMPKLINDLHGGSFPLQACTLGLVVGAGAGLLGGAVPAVRASRLPISVVMRA